MSSSTLSSQSRTILIQNGSQQPSRIQPHSQQSVNHSNTSQQHLQNLKISLQMNKQQMIQLINRNQFGQKVFNFNNQAKKLIEANKIEEALIYLNEAQKILEYAASSGKNIQRKSIVDVLHNQACSYQILWDLQKCSNYIQALIFNFNSELKLTVGFSSGTSSEIHMSSSKKSVKDQIKIQTQKIEKKVDLAKYYLLYCAINSQLKNNQGALVVAKKASQIMKNIMQELLDIYQEQKQNTNSLLLQTLPTFVYPMLQELTKINSSLSPSKLNELFVLVRHYIKVYNSKCVFNSLSSSKGMQSSMNSKDIYQKYKNFSIGNIMQLTPVGNDSDSEKYVQHQSRDTHQRINYEKLIQKLIVFSICQFTMATELRYIALNLAKNDKQKSHQLIEFKQSETYHLLGILLIAMYMPFDIIYMQHIISSYHGHYKTVLLSNGLDGTPELTEEDIKRIKEMVVFERKENLSTSRGKQDQLKKCSTTNQSNSSLIVSFHEEDQQEDSQQPTNKKSKQSSNKKSSNSKHHSHSFVENDLSQSQKNIFDQYYYVKKNTEPEGLAYEEHQFTMKKQPSMLKCVKSKSKTKKGSEFSRKSKSKKDGNQIRSSKSRSKLNVQQSREEKQNLQQSEIRQPRQSQFKSKPSVMFDSKISTLIVPSSLNSQESGLKLNSQRTSHGKSSLMAVPEIYSKITKNQQPKQSRSKDSKKKSTGKNQTIRQQSEYFNNISKKVELNKNKTSKQKQNVKPLKEGKSRSNRKQIKSKRQDQIKTEYFNLQNPNIVKDNKVRGINKVRHNDGKKSLSKSKNERQSSKSLTKARSPCLTYKSNKRLVTQGSRERSYHHRQNIGSIYNRSTIKNNRQSINSKKSQRITVHKLKEVENRLVTEEVGSTMKAGHFNRYYL